jgi:hypothetical protein
MQKSKVLMAQAFLMEAVLGIENYMWQYRNGEKQGERLSIE